MKIVLQRVIEAKVTVDGTVTGQIEKGYVMLLGIAHDDTKEIADKMLEKISKLRLFEDENGKTNLNIAQVAGEVLVISQFTLYADCRKGNRPSFTDAGNPALANELYEYVIEKSSEYFKNTQAGIFGADMKVSLVNDGPFTVVLDSKELFNRE